MVWFLTNHTIGMVCHEYRTGIDKRLNSLLTDIRVRGISFSSIADYTPRGQD